MVKRVLKWVGSVLVVLALVAGGLFYSIFGNNRPIEDRRELASGIEILKDGIVSVAMIDLGGGKLALLDAGNDKSGQAIVDALQRRGLGRAAVSAILLTHGHPDHTAACGLFPDAAVYAMEPERGMIASTCKLTQPLADGASFSLGDTRVEAFALPGHTPGSAAYLLRGVLFFGDSAGAAKDGNVTPAVRLFSKDPVLNVASLKALAARLAPRADEIKTLAFAHAGPLKGFAPLAAFAAAH